MTRADALWRGPALADADDHDFARAPRARLEELRITAAEDEEIDFPTVLSHVRTLAQIPPSTPD